MVSLPLASLSPAGWVGMAEVKRPSHSTSLSEAPWSNSDSEGSFGVEPSSYFGGMQICTGVHLLHPDMYI